MKMTVRKQAPPPCGPALFACSADVCRDAGPISPAAERMSFCMFRFSGIVFGFAAGKAKPACIQVTEPAPILRPKRIFCERICGQCIFAGPFWYV